MLGTGPTCIEMHTFASRIRFAHSPRAFASRIRPHSFTHTQHTHPHQVCKKGFVGELPSEAIAVNRAFENGTAVPRDSIYDIYRHNPWRAPGHAPVADP